MEGIYPFFFIAIGAGFLYFGVLHLSRGRQSESWPFVKGKIISSKIESETEYDDDTGHTTSYSAEIRYEYTVNNRTYESNVISFAGRVYFGRGSAENLVAKYPVLTEVKVYYDPNNPKVATLETGTSVLNYLTLGIGVVVSAIGGWMLLSGFLA